MVTYPAIKILNLRYSNSPTISPKERTKILRQSDTSVPSERTPSERPAPACSCKRPRYGRQALPLLKLLYELQLSGREFFHLFFGHYAGNKYFCGDIPAIRIFIIQSSEFNK